MRVTLKDIAERVGVTKAAVSLALRGSPGVSKEMRELILRVAGEMGYVADPILQRLAAYRRAAAGAHFKSVIAWLNHWPEPGKLRSYHEFELYWRGAAQAAKRLGYRLEEFIWPVDCPAKSAEQKLLELGALGVLIPPHAPATDWGDFDWSKFSLMRFGMSMHRIDSNLVAADHFRATVMAVQKINEHGYRRIGLVYSQSHDRVMGSNYLGGFMWAHNLLKLESVIPPLNTETGSARTAAGSKRNLKAWMVKYRPDAILTPASETPVFLRELGYQIPGDVAVASTSPYDISVDAGIDQCPHTIGQIAAEMLIKQISFNERGVPAAATRILVEGRWREGDSLPSRS